MANNTDTPSKTSEPSRSEPSRFAHLCRVEDAPRIASWMKERGGIAIWCSVDLSDLDKSWTTPVKTETGQPTPCPHWKCERSPSIIIADINQVGVSIDREVKRFHIAVRRGSQGLSLKVTAAGSRRVRKEVEKAGEGAYYTFDYMTQEAVILAPTETPVSLSEWLAKKEAA